MARKGSNIYKRKDGRYEGRVPIGYKENGKLKYKSIYDRTLSGVKEKMTQFYTVRQERTVSNLKLTVQDAAEQWLAAAKLRVKPASYANYANIVAKHILPTLGGEYFSSLTTQKLNSFIQSKLQFGRLNGQGGLSAKTVRDMMRVYRSIEQYAVQEYNVKSTNFTMPKAEKKQLDVLNAAERRQLEQYLLHNLTRTNLGILLCLFTGLRVGELCGLTWGDIDFENGTITNNILNAAIPMLVAQILSLLYNIVDRVYIARIPDVGTNALGAVGLCFPIIMIMTAFSNLFGSGGAPLFSIKRGMGDEKSANTIMNTSFTMLCGSAIILMCICLLFAAPLLTLFGASDTALKYAYPYLCIYLIGTLPSMIATGMNPFINAQGYSTIGMLSVAIGAIANLILDPVFIFILNLGIKGAAVATVISQLMSASFVIYFLRFKAELKISFIRKNELPQCLNFAKDIISLGTSGFVMQLTNSLVSICCNNVLSVTGGDIYISVMTIVSSIRQMVETPIYAINEGSSPIISYNYGAKRPGRVRKAGLTMGALILGYTAVMWSIILLAPHMLINIFSSDTSLMENAVSALKIYFAAFIFMDLQYIGQTIFKSLNKKKQAIFFSLLRKVFIVIPLTYIMPYALNMGTNGVFAAEPVSNIIGGSICFITMLCTILPELKQMENDR